MTKVPIGPPTGPVALALLPTITGELAGRQQELFDARRLHEALWIGGSFSRFIKRRIALLKLVEGADFIIHDNWGDPDARLSSVSYRVPPGVALRIVGAQRTHSDANHAAHREVLRQHCVVFFQRYLEQCPDYQLALNYAVATGLTEAECAGFMRWTVSKWRIAMDDMRFAGLLAQKDQPGATAA